MTSRATFSLLCWLLLITSPALAQTSATENSPDPCRAAQLPWVQVDFSGWKVADEVRVRALRDLRASLQDVGIGACFLGHTPVAAAMARVRVSGRSGQGRSEQEQEVVVTVSVSDAVTAKNLSREIDLRRFPKGARELALAIAADELLRASWAELSLTTAASVKAEKAAPPEAKLAVLQVQKANAEEPLRLGARVAAAAYGGGQRQLGGDGFLVWDVSGCVELRVAFGYRESATQRSPEGVVLGQALLGEGAFGCRFLRTTVLDLSVGVAAVSGRMTFTGRANEVGVGSVHRAWFVYGRSELTSNVHLGASVALPLSLTLGAPIRSATALGDGKPLTQMSGLETGVSLGVQVRL